MIIMTQSILEFLNPSLLKITNNKMQNSKKYQDTKSNISNSFGFKYLSFDFLFDF